MIRGAMKKELHREEGSLSFGAFLKDKLLLFLLHITCMLVLTGYLLLTGYPWDSCALILICWILILTAWTLYAYHDRKIYFLKIGHILDKVDQRFLLGELMPESPRIEDRLYREMIRRSNKSVIERIRRVEDEQREYREYIESWVHEIKAPITSISLICENRREERRYPESFGEKAGKADRMNESDADRAQEVCQETGAPESQNAANQQITSESQNAAIQQITSESQNAAIRQIALENQKVENYVDMALYYARSDEVYKDYVIRETDLQTAAEEAVLKNKYYLIQNQIQVEVRCGEQKVYTDRKWILFILNQLILNCTKYKAKENARIRITAEAFPNGVHLLVEDNGAGIKKEELPRIFEKGFTGTNGRKNDRATGMGLYLCRKLCGKLGIEINARSEYGSGTCIVLEFPISTYVINEA